MGRSPSLDLPACRCETELIRAENMPDTQKQVVTVGVTGASGAILAQKALALLEEDPRVARIHLVVTETGQRLFAEELGISAGDLKQLPARILDRAATKTEILPNKDVGASIASGSYSVDAMLKENRKLVLCVRDTPFNRIHLENMIRAQQAGAVIMPAVPAFYHHPKTIDDFVTQYVCRVLAEINLPQEKMYRWLGSASAREAKA